MGCTGRCCTIGDLKCLLMRRCPWDSSINLPTFPSACLRTASRHGAQENSSTINNWNHTFPNPHPVAHPPPKIKQHMHSGAPPRPLPIFVEPSDVPHGPRANVRHATKSTIRDLFDTLIRRSLQFRLTTPVPYGSPLNLQSFRVRDTPQPTLSP